MDERKKRRASGAQGPEQIADQPAVSLARADERADGENDQGVSTFDRRPQLTDNLEEVAGGSRIGGGRATMPGCEPVSLEVSNGRTRPITPDFAVGTDRAYRHAPED